MSIFNGTENKTPFRPNLDPEQTLEGIVATKPKDNPPYNFEPPNDLLTAAKRATKDYILAQTSKHL